MSVISEIKETVKETNKLIRGAFHKAVDSIFAMDESLTEIAIGGYTPSWNDGDACEHYPASGFRFRDEEGKIRMQSDFSMIRDSEELMWWMEDDFGLEDEDKDKYDAWEDMFNWDFGSKKEISDAIAYLSRELGESVLGTDSINVFRRDGSTQKASMYDNY